MAIAKKTYDFLFKLLLVGDSEAGKTRLLLGFADEAFDSEFISTIAVDFRIKTIELGGRKIKLQIWDTAGQERFQSITTSYYRGANGIMFVYDITNQRTFDHIPEWLQNVDKHSNKDFQKVLVGTNCEMEDKRQVSREKGEQLAALHGIPFIETDTVTNKNVEEAFLALVQAILDKIPDKQTDKEAKAAVELVKNDEKSNCF